MKMTKQEAIEFITNSSASNFYYGDDGVVVTREEALLDIELMDDEQWNKGEVTEAVNEHE
jgi:hypothetical protein